MNISAEPIGAAMGKGRDDKCEVVGQDSFPSPTGRHLSTVTSVCEVLWQATATLTFCCLWHGCGVTHVKRAATLRRLDRGRCHRIFASAS